MAATLHRQTTLQLNKGNPSSIQKKTPLRLDE